MYVHPLTYPSHPPPRPPQLHTTGKAGSGGESGGGSSWESKKVQQDMLEADAARVRAHVEGLLAEGRLRLVRLCVFV